MNGVYVYESHMGGYFTVEEQLFDTYCEQCGDNDWLVGYFEDEEKANKYIETEMKE